ncbi:hypothetical protein FBU30_010784 [Linnemannia zychae]|nr:hypothetical protein FBU30_010784 [Linnemannia zychae]
MKREYLLECESTCGTVIPVENGQKTPPAIPSVAPTALLETLRKNIHNSKAQEVISTPKSAAIGTGGTPVQRNQDNRVPSSAGSIQKSSNPSWSYANDHDEHMEQIKDIVEKNGRSMSTVEDDDDETNDGGYEIIEQDEGVFSSETEAEKRLCQYHSGRDQDSFDMNTDDECYIIEHSEVEQLSGKVVTDRLPQQSVNESENESTLKSDEQEHDHIPSILKGDSSSQSINGPSSPTSVPHDSATTTLSSLSTPTRTNSFSPRAIQTEDLKFDIASACANTFASDLAYVLARVPSSGAHFHRFEQLGKLKLHVGWVKHARSRGENDIFVMSCSRLIGILAPLANTPLVSER